MSSISFLFASHISPQEFAAVAVPVAGLLAIVMIVAMWKIFSKAGKPGWAALIPIYNIVIILEIAERPLWWIVLFLIPGVSIVAAIIVWIDVAKAFGKSTGYGLGMVFLSFIFMPMLGFGSAEYVGLGREN